MNPFGILTEFVARTETLRTLSVMTIVGAVVALLLFAVKPLLRNRLPKAAQYYLWVVALAAFLVPVSAFITLPSHNSAPSISGAVDWYIVDNEDIWRRVEPYERADDNGYVGIPAEYQETVDAFIPEPWVTGAVDIGRTVWFFGFLIVLGAFWLSYLLYCEKTIKRSNKAAFPAEKNLLASLKADPPELYRNQKAPTPMLIGLFRPAIVLPDREYTDERLKSVLLHELTHLRRKDIWIKWLTVLAMSVHWFNPAVRLLRREINRACELACDEAVIGKLDDDGKQSYGDTLIAVAVTNEIPHTVLSTTMCEQKKSLRERLAAIMTHKKHTRAAVIVSAALIIAAAGTACALGAGSGNSTTIRDLAHFGVNGFALGDLPPDTQNLIPTGRYNDDYENNLEGVRYTTDKNTGVIRRMFVDVLESGMVRSLDDATMRTPWWRLSEIRGFFGEGKEGWQDRGQGLRYVEYKQVSGRLSASVRFVYIDDDEKRLVWVIAESSLPYLNPENPPAISVSANGKPLEWIVGINVWNGAIVDRAENFMAFMEGETIDDLPLVSIGETVTVDFGGYPPSAVIVSESILNESGAPKWRTDEFPKNYNIGMAGGIGKFTIEPNYATALSSNSADYAPGRTIKGYKLVCQWLKPDGSTNECEYAFVIRGDAAISMVQEESATQSSP
jgi:beta-lactamase regulating signal transducer with metallopeptidase domain